MARADRNDLKQSRIELDRQQRKDHPKVPGASGSDEPVSPDAAEEQARKRHGKTSKHTSDDAPEA